MSAMTTVLTEFSDKENSRTYTLAAHTVQLPRLVTQKRTVPSNNTASAEDDIRIVYGTVDALGELLASKVSFEVIVRRPANGVSADVTSALAVFRDIIAGDEFANTVATQEYLK